MTVRKSGSRGGGSDPPGGEIDETLALIESFHSGDSKALARLLDHHRTWIQRAVRKQLAGIVRQLDDTGDIIQNATLRILKMKQLRFRTGNEFRALVSKAVASAIASLASKYNAEKRNRRRVVELGDDQTSFLDAAASRRSEPSSKAAKKESAEIVNLALQLLDLETQRLFHLRVERDLSWPEVGEVLGIDENAARGRYDRAIVRLQRKILAVRAGRLDKALEDDRR